MADVILSRRLKCMFLAARGSGHDVVSAARSLQQRLWRARSLEPRCRIENIDLCLVRMQPNQHAVGTQPESVADNVVAGRNIDGAVLRDRLLNQRGLIGRAVAFRSQRPQIDPFRDRRQTADCVRHRWRQGLQRCRIITRLDLAGRAFRGESQSVGKDFHLVYLSGSGKLPAALSESRKHGHPVADDVLQIDLRHPAILVADHNRRAADVLETRVLHPKLIGITPVDRDRRRHVAELIVHQRQSRLILPDRRLPLAVEARIDHRKLPGRRRLAREDAITAGVEMQVFRLVARILNAGKTGADLEIHVSQITMLRNVKADSDRRRIVAADLEIDIAHRGIEGTRVRIDDRPSRRYRSRRRLRHAVVPPWGRRAGKSPPDEEEHAADSLLEARGPVRQHEYRTLLAVTDQAHARRNIDGSSNAIASLRNKEDALARCLLNHVNRGLDRRTIVGIAVAANRKLIWRQVNGLRIVQPRKVKRCSTGRQSASQQNNPEHHEFPHRSPPNLVICRSLILSRRSRRAGLWAMYSVEAFTPARFCTVPRVCSRHARHPACCRLARRSAAACPAHTSHAELLGILQSLREPSPLQTLL